MPVWSTAEVGPRGGGGGWGLGHGVCGMGQGSGQELDHLPAVRKLLFPLVCPPPFLLLPSPAVPYIKDALFMLGNQLMPVCYGARDR